LSRFAISAWVGAACLFVLTTLREVHSPKLDSVTKAELVTLRFPVYYGFSFGLLAMALIMALCWSPIVSGLRRWTTLGLLSLILVVTAVDYIWIYKPLEKMTAATDEARPAEFVVLHQASRWINTGQVSASALAALIVCWPVSSSADRSP